jgi:hypothetical protein
MKTNGPDPLPWMILWYRPAPIALCLPQNADWDLMTRLYVLCGSPANQRENAQESSSFTSEVFSSTNLKDWTLEAGLTMPALPNALEVTDMAFFIGLANSKPWKSADVASGNIYRLSRVQQN